MRGKEDEGGMEGGGERGEEAFKRRILISSSGYHGYQAGSVSCGTERQSLPSRQSHKGSDQPRGQDRNETVDL